MNNQKGVTLVELLATLVLLSLVTVLLISIIVQSQNTYKRSQLTNVTTTEITFLINSITRDIRQNPENISSEGDVLTISPSDGAPIVYSYDPGQLNLNRNNQTIISNVHDFKSPPIKDGFIKLELKDSNGKTWKSTIAIRTGGEL